MTARGLLLKAGLACAAALASPAAAAEDVALSIEATGEGSYKVEGRFSADVTSRAAWDVLTDYDRLPEFVSSLRLSKVRERRGERILLEQIAAGRVFVFSRAVRVLLEVREAPRRMIVFEDVSGDDFEYYAGSWTIEESTAAPQVRIVYALEATRKFAVPDFVARSVLRRNARGLLADVRREMLRRAAIAAGGAS